MNIELFIFCNFYSPQDGFPVWFREIHVVNAPRLFNLAYNVSDFCCCCFVVAVAAVVAVDDVVVVVVVFTVIAVVVLLIGSILKYQ